jgi:hypothetical protein
MTKDKTKKTKKARKAQNKAIIIIMAITICVIALLILMYSKGWIGTPGVETPTPTPFESSTETPIISETPAETPTETPETEVIPEGYVKIETSEDLKEYLEVLMSEGAGVYGLSYYNFTTSETIDILKEEDYPSAASLTVPAVMYLYKAAKEGKMSVDAYVEYSIDDNTEGPGVVNKGTYGDQYTLRALAEYAITQNDICALKMIVRTCGKQNIIDYLVSLGASSDADYISADDMVLCIKEFKKMYDSDPVTYADLMGWLCGTQINSNESSKRVLPVEIKAACSTTYISTVPPALNDTLLVYAKDTYILSVCASYIDTDEAAGLLKKAGLAVYEFVQNGSTVVEWDREKQIVILDKINEQAKAFAKKFTSSVMYPNGMISSYYVTDEAISFASGEEYGNGYGVLGYRGNNYRDDGAYGTVDVTESKLTEIWSFDIGGMTGFGSIWPGVGWTGQACAIKWDDDVKQMMNIYEKFKQKEGFTEVIYATLDGNIYFFDLDTGEKTRDFIYIGVPIKGTLSLDPRGYPLLYVGQGLEGATTDEGVDRYKAFGYRIFSLINQTLLYEIKGYDTFAYRSGWGAFDSSGLMDIENDTYYECGENGLIYKVQLNTVFDKANKTISVDPEITRFRYAFSGNYASYGIESSPAIYDRYMYFTDNSGTLFCLDLKDMRILWAYDTWDDSDSSVTLEVTEEGVFLYTANEVDLRRTDSECNIRKFNALTGELIWQVDVPCYYIDDVNGGALASPIIGRNDLDGLVIFNICRTVEESGSIWSGRLYAFNKYSGAEVWVYKSAYSWSSPVAVYTAAGKGYIVYAEHTGKIDLIDGLTGSVKNQVTLSEGDSGYKTIEATPVIYNGIIVIGSYAEKIYGVSIK